MKKQFTTLFLMAATVFAALTFNSCSEEEQPTTQPVSGHAVFATGSENGTRSSITIVNEDGTPADEGTRTSIDAYRFFYWGIGDKIWVKDGSTFHSSVGSDILGQAEEAKFIVSAALGEREYPLLYTGYINGDTTTTHYSSVTIAAMQTQSDWNNGSHLGTSGDCGVATATKRESGTYQFTLKHKASYLIFQPYLKMIGADYTLHSIEITADGTSIAGTYNFDENGLSTSVVRSPSSTVTLNCTDGFKLSTAATNSCFVVIQPGTHTLTIRYKLKPQVQGGNQYDPYNVAEMSFVKEISARNYQSGYAYVIKHELSNPILTYSPTFYMWDALAENPYEFGTNSFNDVAAPTSASEIATHRATNTSASAPNVNQLYWYIMNGDMRWDGETQWMVEGSSAIHTGGIWIKRGAHITAGGDTFRADIGRNDEDMRLGSLDSQTNRITYPRIALTVDNPSQVTTYRTAGKPANTAQYFYIPALGYYSAGNGVHVSIGVNGSYWSSSPTSSAQAYRLSFDHLTANFDPTAKGYGFPSNYSWFK